MITKKIFIHSKKALVLFDQALVSGGNFILGVLLARFLGLEAFGTYSLLWMGVLFVLGLHQAYLTQPLMSLFVGKKEAEGSYLKSVFQLQALVSASMALIGLLAFFALIFMDKKPDWAGYLPLGGFLAAVFLLQDFLRRLFFVKQQFLQPLLMDGVLYAILFSGLVGLHLLGFLDLGTALWCLLISYGISSALGCFFAHKAGLSPSFGRTVNAALLQKTAKEHYHYSFWLLGTSLVQWFSGNFFLIAAAGVLGTMAVGALRMAQNMVGLCHVLFLAMENIVPTEAARQFFQDGEKKAMAYLRRVALLGSLPVGLMLAGLTLASPLLIKWLYGSDYQSFTQLVGAYAFLYIFVYFGFPLRFALRTLHRNFPIFLAYCLCAGASLLLAFPMARQWGLSGVMAGLIATQVLTLVVYVLFLLKTNAPTNPHPLVANH